MNNDNLDQALERVFLDSARIENVLKALYAIKNCFDSPDNKNLFATRRLLADYIERTCSEINKK